MDLNVLWFVLIAVLLTGYAVLDGFDLGVGVLHLFSKGEKERRTLINAVGPVWDGNEVWLLTGGGAIFAAFPHVYATVFSGFYLALMLLLLALILRAISMELRGKEPMAWWRKTWDVAFSLGSFLAVTLLGVALGNIAHGVPLGPGYEFQGNFFTLLNPYSLVVGLTGVALATTHGAGWLLLKTEGDLQRRVRGWGWTAFLAFAVLYLVMSVWTVVGNEHIMANFGACPVLWLLPVLSVAGVGFLGYALRRGTPLQAFLGSALTIALLMVLFATGMFPDLVYSSPDPAWTLDLHNAASSRMTLGIMAIIAGLGVPVVLVYTAWAYRVFWGKVELDDGSY
ncbi:MAG: cytochrome d ubiquinol oxidase subunit II [Pseudomonadota bacterium]